jgi:NADH-quinone oxidoreductase subunit I
LKFKEFIRLVTFQEIIKGMRLTLATMKLKPVTKIYPKERPVLQPKYRGLHALRRNGEGKEMCVACGLCAAYCPTGCINIETKEGDAHDRVLVTYEIDIAKCMFCGYCVDACPVKALVMTAEYELSVYDRKKLIYTKEMLLANGEKYKDKEVYLG